MYIKPHFVCFISETSGLKKLIILILLLLLLFSSVLLSLSIIRFCYELSNTDILMSELLCIISAFMLLKTKVSVHTKLIYLKAQSQVFLGTESPLKMMKKAFYFTSKALFVLRIFKFWFCPFGRVSKRLD